MPGFSRLELRTTEPAMAAAHYAKILGRVPAPIVEIPAPARARGAPPHWLGHLDPGGRAPEALVETWVGRGATRLSVLLLRDDGGAVVGVSSTPGSTTVAALHVLSSPDPARSAASYGALFGWSIDGEHTLAFEPGGPPVGHIFDLRGRAGVHPHWLFFFEVPSRDAASRAVRAVGGLVVEELERPIGKLGVYDDAQGAAFGVVERART